MQLATIRCSRCFRITRTVTVPDGATRDEFERMNRDELCIRCKPQPAQKPPERREPYAD
jgi:hypothetical protein